MALLGKLAVAHKDFVFDGAVAAEMNKASEENNQVD
jgi:hypothetical protein